MSFIAAGISLVGGIVGGIGANKMQKAAEEKERKAREEMNQLKATYSNLDTSNPYLNMDNKMRGLENTMEDLTVNQGQAQFEKQMAQQSQANILDSMRGAAGGSGIAATAQAMAQQGQLSAQRASVSIGQQESANQAKKAGMAGQLQMAEAGEASKLQGMERQGEVWSRNAERDKQGTLLGMSQQETAAYGQQASAAESAKWDAFGSGISGIAEAFSDRKLKKNITEIGRSPSNLKIYTFEYINKEYGEGIFQGVMSDEVPQESVIKNNDGYDLVDYSNLDVEFKKIS